MNEQCDVSTATAQRLWADKISQSLKNSLDRTFMNNAAAQSGSGKTDPRVSFAVEKIANGYVVISSDCSTYYCATLAEAGERMKREVEAAYGR